MDKHVWPYLWLRRTNIALMMLYLLYWVVLSILAYGFYGVMLIYGLLWLAVMLHEGGHVLAGLWLGKRVRAIVLGYPPVWRGFAGRTLLVLGPLPPHGYVRVLRGDLPFYSGGSLLISSAGIGVNLMAGMAALWVDMFVFQLFAVMNIFTGLILLYAVDDKGSDGHKIMLILLHAKWQWHRKRRIRRWREARSI